MKKIKNQNPTKAAIFAGAAALMALTPRTHAQAADDMLINKLEQKGILSVDEAKELRAEAAEAETNQASQFVSASKLKIADSIKSMQLFGDVRLRYEYRGVDNSPKVALPNYGTVGSGTFDRERFRYALRVGVRGDLFDDFNYGLRLETSSNPRSPWDTFGNNTTSGSATPSDKAQSGIGIGQIYIGWRPTDWFEMTVGRMPMPLYTTPMVWDSDINPEGAFEKFKITLGNVDWFADFGQFDYQDPTSASDFPSTDTFLLAWQLGANVRIGKDVSFKIAPMLYTYVNVPPAPPHMIPLPGLLITMSWVSRSPAREIHTARMLVPPFFPVLPQTWHITNTASTICSSWKSPWNTISKSGNRRWALCRDGCLETSR